MRGDRDLFSLQPITRAGPFSYQAQEVRERAFEVQRGGGGGGEAAAAKTMIMTACSRRVTIGWRI